MTVTFAGTVFDNVVFDRDADVLYLNVEGAEPVVWDETPEGHVIRFDESKNLCGLTVIGVQHHMDDEGHVNVTIPVHKELGAEDLDLVLA